MDQEFSRSNFGLASYTDEQGKLRKSYDMTEEGFSYEGMVFTGAKAKQSPDQTDQTILKGNLP